MKSWPRDKAERVAVRVGRGVPGAQEGGPRGRRDGGWPEQSVAAGGEASTVVPATGATVVQGRSDARLGNGSRGDRIPRAAGPGGVHVDGKGCQGGPEVP